MRRAGAGRNVEGQSPHAAVGTLETDRSTVNDGKIYYSRSLAIRKPLHF
jgi:hypothetical protein